MAAGVLWVIPYFLGPPLSDLGLPPSDPNMSLSGTGSVYRAMVFSL
jgi:hypothetical protein